jgi:hydroxyacylglutathione hydrolase
MMWDSLSKLAALPPETLVCSGHEYTQANARFALTIEPDNAASSPARKIDAARAAGRPTVPSTLAEELATNPFLRAGLPEMKATPRYAVGGRRRRVCGNSSAQGRF